MHRLLKLYRPTLRWALNNRRAVITMTCGIFLISLVAAFGLPRPVLVMFRNWKWNAVATVCSGQGSEFMPTLNEGSLLLMPTLLPSTSLTEIKRVMSWQDQVLKQVPEVVSAAGKLGRAETATDPAPVEMIETTIELKPESEWRAGMTKQKLIAELNEKLSQVPGCVPGFLHPIEGRILMLSTGIRAQVGIKVLGDNLETLQAKAFEIQQILQTVTGAAGVVASRSQSKPYVEIEVDRPSMARYGLRSQDVMDIVEAGIGGKNLGSTISGRERYPIQVRFRRSDRDNIETLSDALVFSPSGRVITLGQVATIKRVIGPSEIGSENGRLRVFVQANVVDRDLGSFVNEAREKIAREVSVDTGMTIEWAGQYENQLRAQSKLRIILPTVIAIIFILLYVLFKSAKEAAHIILAVPFALTGGMLLQSLLGYNFSVAVWVGYIALFGIAIQTAVVMVVYLEEAYGQRQMVKGNALDRQELTDAVLAGAELRLRPKVMTVVTTVASLIPLMWSNSTGAEIMRPIAAPVLGGMISSFFHILIVTPVIYHWLREPRRM
jgi:Cu(I)/Ag(I) efflux system membrane protein CusA/SilA